MRNTKQTIEQIVRGIIRELGAPYQVFAVSPVAELDNNWSILFSVEGKEVMAFEVRIEDGSELEVKSAVSRHLKHRMLAHNES